MIHKILPGILQSHSTSIHFPTLCFTILEQFCLEDKGRSRIFLSWLVCALFELAALLVQLKTYLSQSPNTGGTSTSSLTYPEFCWARRHGVSNFHASHSEYLRLPFGPNLSHVMCGTYMLTFWFALWMYPIGCAPKHFLLIFVVYLCIGKEYHWKGSHWSVGKTNQGVV